MIDIISRILIDLGLILMIGTIVGHISWKIKKQRLFDTFAEKYAHSIKYIPIETAEYNLDQALKLCKNVPTSFKRIDSYIRDDYIRQNPEMKSMSIQTFRIHYLLNNNKILPVLDKDPNNKDPHIIGIQQKQFDEVIQAINVED